MSVGLAPRAISLTEVVAWLDEHLIPEQDRDEYRNAILHLDIVWRNAWYTSKEYE